MALPLMEKWVYDIGPANRVGDVAVCTLKAGLERVQYYLRRAAKNGDKKVELVHNLRVWTRRTSAAMKLYGDFLPRKKAARIKKWLKCLRHIAGDIRDCDVLARKLVDDYHPEGKHWLKEIIAQRADAERPLVKVYKRLRRNHYFEHHVRNLLHRVKFSYKSHESTLPPFGDWAHSRLKEAVKRFFKAAPADNVDIAELHQFRIQTKELRYIMEMLAGAFPSDFRTKLYPRIVALQDRLGDIHDLVVEREWLRQRFNAVRKTAVAKWLRKPLAELRLRLEERREDFLIWCNSRVLDKLRTEFDGYLRQ